jgi:hypothetical protein
VRLAKRLAAANAAAGSAGNLAKVHARIATFIDEVAVQKKILNWAECVIVGTIALLSFLGVLFFLRTFGAPLWSQEASGWAQAFGSIAAILAGFGVANRQAKDAAQLARRDRIEADDDRLTAALCVGMYAADLIEEAVAAAATRSSVTGYLEVSCYYLDFEGAVRALQAIPLYELRSTAMVGGLLKMQRCIEQLDRMTTNAQADSFFYEHDYSEWQEGIIEIRDAKNAAMQILADAVESSRALLREHM